MKKLRLVAVRNWRSLRTRSTTEKSILLSFCVFMVFLLKHMASKASRDETDFMEYLHGAWQGDPDTIMRLSVLLLAPTSDELALQDPKRRDFSGYGQSSELAKIFKHKEFGFFIEAHAGDGEKGSVSLYFERNLKWYGLLVEDDYDTFGKLMAKNRRSYGFHAKVSTTERVRMSKESFNNTDWVDPSEFYWEVPLYALYKVMGSDEVDLLILDTKGTELQILQTLPWDSVKFKVLCIAYTHIPGNPRSLPEYLSLKGYTLLKTHVKDMFFASNEFLQEQNADQKR
ncbi:protein Star-like isoform X2 [Macrobrachium rosenbergii]